MTVYEQGEALSPKCSNDSQKAYSLEDLPQISLNNTLVRICSERLTLDTVIEISSGANIDIVGYGLPQLWCSNATKAGVIFNEITNLSLSSFTMINCALLFPENSIENIKTALLIMNSTNITLQRVFMSNSPGTGLSMFGNSGIVLIMNCSFERNGLDERSGGNGIYMEVSAVVGTPYSAKYTISDSIFRSNSASTGRDSGIKGFSRFDKGGGMCITCLDCQNVIFQLLRLRFEDNVASTYGGGLFITYHGGAMNSSVHLYDSYLVNNTGQYGGGLYIGYLHSRVPLKLPFNCSYQLESVNFISNMADFGGGISIYSTKTFKMEQSTLVTFQNCLWQENFGHYGSAISLLPNAWNLYDHGYLPTPVFNNCTIKSNYVLGKTILSKGNFYQYYDGAGAFYCSRHNVTFKNETKFLSNNGSALYLLMCLATFYDYSQVVFDGNSGYSGGAIYLLSSITYFSNNCRGKFEGNYAFSKGGAVYEEAPLPHIREYSKTCFLDYVDDFKDIPMRNISVSFLHNIAGAGNKAAAYGHSIYGTSLQPCYTRFGIRNSSVDIFSQIGNFSYWPDLPFNIATDADHSDLPEGSYWENDIAFIPGKPITLNFTDIDDLGQLMKTSYSVSVSEQSSSKSSFNSSIAAKQAYSYVSNYTLALTGPSNVTGNVTLTSTSSRLFSITFKLFMEPCPPGFVQQIINENMQCVCPNETVDKYSGINICDFGNFRAFRKRGYWVGYENDANEDSLLSGQCPAGYCSYENLLLPDSANKKQISSHMCMASRSGKLCGKCIDNHSVYYNSLDFGCKKNNALCNWGWLFYMLSELLPTALVFIVVIFFNISFTTGLLNGFLFYAQIVEWLHISDFLTVPFSEGAAVFNRLHIFMYRMFSLQFFELETFSFCLWKGSTALDIFAFQYIQLIFASALIAIVIVAVNKFYLVNICKMKCFRLPASNGGVIHGLSAFLILCYSQCLNTSIMILSSSQIDRRGSVPVAKVVYYDGEMEWFGLSHFKYAVPAIVFSLAVVVLPPIVLLIYPLHYKVLAVLKVDQNTCIKYLFRPLEKMKPFLDSFQGCFKDEYRFFSGFYLLYRLMIQLTMGLIYIHQSYLILQFELILIFILHSVCNPYKEKWHNTIDTLLMCNLILINGITLYNVSIANTGNYGITDFQLTTWTQVLLIFLPAIVAAVVAMYKMCTKAMVSFRRKELNSDEDNYSYPVRFEYTSLDSS